MEIKRNLFALLLSTSIAFGLSSCASDYFSNNDRVKGDDVELNMQVNIDTKAGNTDDAESMIKSVRVIIFVSTASNNAGLPPGYVLINNRYNNPNEIPTLRFTPGLRDMYVVANETEKMRERLDKVRTVEQLHAINVEYDPDAPSATKPFVMCAEMLQKQFKGGTTQDVSFSLLRIAAKAQFNFSFNALAAGIDAGLHDKPLVVDSVKIMQISDSTMLARSAPVYAPHKQLSSHRLEITQPQNPKNWTINGELYLTERLFVPNANTSDPKQATYMMVYAHLDGIDCRYRIEIGNVAGKGITKPDYTITRNTQYNITGTITKIGEMGGMDVEISVVPWNVTYSRPEMGQFTLFTRATRANGVEITDGDFINHLGETIKIYCTTNIGGWYVKISDIRPYIPETTISAKTDAVNSPTEQYIDIILPSKQVASYAITICRPRYTHEDEIPVKTMIWQQEGGILWNHDLVLDFYMGEFGFSGFRLDQLPPHGIQIAKRGNILPTSPSINKTETFLTVPTVEFTEPESDSIYMGDYGTGRRRTDYLLSKYPAFANSAMNVCKKLGPEWYLPTSNELSLILSWADRFKNTDYSFDQDTYLSCSPRYRTSGILNGYSFSKNWITSASEGFIRCVKDI